MSQFVVIDAHAVEFFELNGSKDSIFVQFAGKNNAQSIASGEVGYLANRDKINLMYFGMTFSDPGPKLFSNLVNYGIGVRLYGGNDNGDFVLEVLSEKYDGPSTVEFGALAFGGTILIRPLSFYRKMAIALEFFYANDALSYDEATALLDYSSSIQIEHEIDAQKNIFFYLGSRRVEMTHKRTNQDIILDRALYVGLGVRGW